jgi:hypothetical protein
MTYNPPNPFQIDEVTRFSDTGMFGTSTARHGTHALVRFDNGDTVGVSRFDDEPAGRWIADSAMRANGMPLWSNGHGARYLAVREITDPAVIDELDQLAGALVNGASK